VETGRSSGSTWGLCSSASNYSRGVPTATAADDDDQPGLTDAQRAALVNAVSTPAFRRSLEQLQEQINRPLAGALQRINEQAAATIAAQMEPVLRASRLQLAAQNQMRAALEPMFAQIAARQREWAQALTVPVLASVYTHPQITGLVVSPEFTRSLQRISELSRLRVELPDTDGVDRLLGLLDEGEFDAETLSAAEDGVAADTELSEAIDEAARVLSSARPWISRKRARQMVVVWVWLMWAAALTVVAVAAPTAIATFVNFTGLPAGMEAAKRVGTEFDRRFPPIDDSGDD